MLSARLAAIESAHAAGALTDHSLETIRVWLTEPRYAEFAATLGDLVDGAAAAGTAKAASATKADEAKVLRRQPARRRWRYSAAR